MRLLYGVLTVGSGEWSILKEPGDSPDDVGRMSVPFPYKSASTYVLMKDMLAVRPDLHITFVGKFGGWHGEKPGLYEDATNPRLAWVVVPKNMADEIGPPYCAGLTHYTSMFSDQTKGALPIDAVVGDLPHYSKQMSLQMTAGKRVVPGIARHETACDSGGYLVSWGKPGRDAWLGQVVAGLNLGQWHVFLSEWQRKVYFRKLMAPYLSASVLRRLMAESVVVENGIDLDLLDSLIEQEGGLSWDRGRTLGSFYRFGHEKGTPPVFEMFNKMMIAGQADRVVVTNTKGDKIENVLKSGIAGQWDYTPTCDRETYLRKAMQAAVAVYNSPGESSALCPVEAAYMGCVPLLPKRQWALDTFGRHDWPLIYSSMDEAHSMAMNVLDDYEKWGRRSREYVAEHHDVRKLGAVFLDHVQLIAQGQNKIASMTDQEFVEWCDGSRMIEAIDKLAAGRSEVSWAELVKAVPVPRDTLGMPVVVTHHDLPALMSRRTGFVDDCTGAVPTFRRP